MKYSSIQPVIIEPAWHKKTFLENTSGRFELDTFSFYFQLCLQIRDRSKLDVPYLQKSVYGGKMKKLTILFLLCFAAGIIHSQAIYWEETFSPAPAGWNLDSNWSFTNSALQLSWTPTITNYDLAAVSPLIQLPFNVGDLIILQYIDNFSGVDEIMEISLLIDGNPAVLWEYQLTLGNWGNSGGTELILPLSDFAGEEVQLRFRSYGSSTWNLNYWYIYELAISALFDNDLAAVEVNGPPNAQLNQPDLWKVVVKNCGLLAQDLYTVKLFGEDGIELGCIDVAETIEPFEQQEHNFYWTPAIQGNTYLYGEVILPGDEFNGNDTSPNHDVQIFPEGERQYLVWDNDNNSYYYDPNTNQFRDSEYGIVQALIDNGISFQTVTQLPSILRNYHVVFVCLGLYCVG